MVCFSGYQHWKRYCWDGVTGGLVTWKLPHIACPHFPNYENPTQNGFWNFESYLRKIICLCRSLEKFVVFVISSSVSISPGFSVVKLRLHVCHPPKRKFLCCPFILWFPALKLLRTRCYSVFDFDSCQQGEMLISWLLLSACRDSGTYCCILDHIWEKCHPAFKGQMHCPTLPGEATTWNPRYLWRN